MTDAQASQLADQIRDFFDVFSRASATLDLDVLAGLFAETFLSSDQAGTMMVPRAAFVRALPRRAQAFADAGVGPAVLARTTWDAPRTRSGNASGDSGGTDRTSANNDGDDGSSSGASGTDAVRLESSFLLRRDGERLSVVAYITHQGLGS